MPASIPVSRKTVYLITAASIAAVAATAARLVDVVRQPPVDRLIQASSKLPRRQIAARLAGFPFRQPPETGDIAPAAALIMRAAAADVTATYADDPHAVALAQILSGNPTRAVATLQSIGVHNRDNPRYWNDFAAAAYEAGRAKSDPLMYAVSLGAADRALSIEPGHYEASFNRALSLEFLGLSTDAARAYRYCLAHDQSSEWAAEVRGRLRNVERPTTTAQWNQALKALDPPQSPDMAAIVELASRFPQAARTYAEGEFVARWAEAVLRSDAATAAHWLEISRLIGSGLRARKGEHLLSEAVAAIETAAPSKAAEIASAQLAYRRGRILLARRKPAEAVPLLAEAEREFASGGSPMALVAAYFRANAAHDAHDSATASRILDQLSTSVPVRYRALRAQLFWLRALLNVKFGRPFDALAATDVAIEEFDELEEIDFATRMRGMKASLLAILGRDSEAWQHRSRAFRDANAMGTGSVLEVILNGAARDEIRSGRWQVAGALLRLELSRPAISARLRADALTWLAFVDAEISGQPPDFRAATAAAEAITDRSLQAEALNEVWFAQGVRQRRSAADAIELLTRVIDSGVANASPVLAGAAYVERAKAYRELMAHSEAERDLRRALVTTGSMAGNVGASELPDTYFGAAHDAYGQLFDLLASQGRFEEAFEIASRGRALAGQHNAAKNHVSSVAALQKRLPPGVLFAQYTATDTRLVIIAVSQQSWRHTVIPIGKGALTAMADELATAIGKNDTAAIHVRARQIHKYLIEPLSEELATARTLAVSPDVTIAGIPFAALRDKDGRWLIEQFTIVTAHSGGVLDRQPESDGAVVTAIADPAFDPGLFPTLPRLRAAQIELEGIRRIFPKATTFIGAGAVSSLIKEAVKGSDIIHFATHAFSDPHDASRSVLVLAPTDGDHGFLHAGDIAALDLDRAPLIVLAGCRTGALGGGRGNIRSIAQAFLLAGGRAVVGTLWDVDDAETSAMTLDFYTELHKHDDAAISLRNTQLKGLTEGRGLRTWAAFQLQTAGY